MLLSHFVSPVFCGNNHRCHAGESVPVSGAGELQDQQAHLYLHSRYESFAVVEHLHSACEPEVEPFVAGGAEAELDAEQLPVV